ncbi:MAG: hypothetical protein ACXABO_01075 [Promethearchaeota archaeon]
MESLKTVTSIEIPTNKISYDKKTSVFSVEIFDFMFVGIYKKSTRISTVLDDIYASLGEVQMDRDDLHFIDSTSHIKIHGNTKLKSLKISERKEPKKEKKKALKAGATEEIEVDKLYELEEEEAFDEDIGGLVSIDDEFGFKDEKVKEKVVSRRDERKEDVYEKEEAKPKAKKKPMAPPPAPGGGPSAGAPSRARSSAPPPPPSPAPASTSDMLAGPGAPPPPKPEPEPAIVAPEEPQPIVYDINMGLQYYSVMMEQRSYLFYVYFSHKELKIVDEEGKTVYETTIKIVTTKEEPPILDLKIEGEGFEVHPIFGKVEVSKDAVNPPVMIFSIMPTKSLTKKKRKEFERRHLNVYIDFEENTISHTILSIIVQPKFFRLDIGPIHLNLSKKTAVIISVISILIAGISLVYTLLSIDPSSTFMDLIGGWAPGLGSVIFIAIFLFTLLKEGIFPLKQKISGLLNFDQAGILIK